MGSLTGAKIPLIDFTTDDLNPGSSSWVCVCRDLCSALEEYGFFIAKYDEVYSQLNEAIFGVSKELFHLPTDIKIKNVNSKPFLGYHGQLAARPLYESFGIDYVTDKEQVHEFTNTMWPSGKSDFRYITSDLSFLLYFRGCLCLSTIHVHFAGQRNCVFVLKGDETAA